MENAEDNKTGAPAGAQRMSEQIDALPSCKQLRTRLSPGETMLLSLLDWLFAPLDDESAVQEFVLDDDCLNFFRTLSEAGDRDIP